MGAKLVDWERLGQGVGEKIRLLDMDLPLMVGYDTANYSIGQRNA